MAEMTHEDIERIWNSFSHYVPDRQKSDAAVEFVNALKFLDIDPTQIKASADVDPAIQAAVDSAYEDDDEEDEYGDDGELVY